MRNEGLVHHMIEDVMFKPRKRVRLTFDCIRSLHSPPSTFPLIFSCLFLTDLPCFHVRSHGVLPSHPGSRGPPTSSCQQLFLSSFHVPEPIQPSLSHHRCNQFRPCCLQDLLNPLIVPVGSPHCPYCTILISAVALRFSPSCRHNILAFKHVHHHLDGKLFKSCRS